MPKIERTFVLLKPDAIQRGLIGEIIKRIEQRGLKIISFKLVVPTEEQVFAHYNKDDEWFKKKGQGVVDLIKERGEEPTKEAIEYGKDIVRALAKYMVAGPSLALVVEGHNAVNIILKITGSTEPATADIGTIRGDFAIETFALANTDDRAVRNLIHCSESVEEAKREIDLWIKPEEIVDYRGLWEDILYAKDLKGIL